MSALPRGPQGTDPTNAPPEPFYVGVVRDSDAVPEPISLPCASCKVWMRGTSLCCGLHYCGGCLTQHKHQEPDHDDLAPFDDDFGASVTVPSYTEEDVERTTRTIMNAAWGSVTDEEWAVVPDHEKQVHYRVARAALDDLAAAGRLVPPGSETREEWGCATPSEVRKQNPVRWSTREAAKEHGNCGSCVIVSRIVTPWSPSVPDTKEET